MKNKSIEKAGRLAWLFALRVFETEDFKSDAIKFRKQFKIPKQGFKSFSDSSVWFTQLYYDTIDQVGEDKQSALKTMAQRFKRYGQIHNDDLNKFSNDRRFRILEAWFALEDIRHKYAIPPRWTKSLLTILLTTSTHNVGLPAGVGVIKKINSQMYEEEIEVRVDRFTRRRDFDEAWKVVKQMQKTLWGGEVRTVKVREFKKYEKVVQLRRQGLTYQQIGDKFGITSGEAKNWETRYFRAIGINKKRTRFL